MHVNSVVLDTFERGIERRSARLFVTNSCKRAASLDTLLGRILMLYSLDWVGGLWRVFAASLTGPALWGMIGA